MAKLQSDSLVLDINFFCFEKDWIAYDVRFYWKEELIVRDEILKRTGDWWYKRRYGTFIANDYQKDHLIDVINKVLETNEPDYWEPIEPDIIIGIYPYIFFPFLKSHWIETNGEKYIGKEKNEKINEKIKSPEDIFTIITMIDTYNFKDSDCYSSDGISLHLITTREDLEKFAKDLEVEYNNVINTVLKK